MFKVSVVNTSVYSPTIMSMTRCLFNDNDLKNSLLISQ